MSSLPLVSVVIPTFNRAYCLPDTIKSVLNQTYKNIELIIVDDGSTDDTREILKQFKDKVNYIYQENAGLASARNKGLECCNGELIALLDSDDIWYEDKLRRQVTDMGLNPEIDIQITNAHITRDHIKNEVSIFDYINFSKHLSKELTIVEDPSRFQFQYGIAWVQCALMKRSVLFDDGLYDENLTIYTDYDLFCRLSLKTTWGICAREYVKIKREMNKPNVSAQRIEKPVHAYKSLVYIYQKILQKYSLDKLRKNTVLNHLYSSRATLGMTYLEHGDVQNARVILYENWKQKPTFKALFRMILAAFPFFMNKTYFVLRKALVCSK